MDNVSGSGQKTEAGKAAAGEAGMSQL